MYQIFDAHCHIYPLDIAPRAVAGVDAFYDGLPVKPRDGTAQTLLETGREAGISRFLVHSVATTPHQVGSINRFIAAQAASSGGRLTGRTTGPVVDRAAKEAGEKLGMTVLLGAEIQLLCSPNHYLLYGADEAFFETAPDLLLFTPEQLYDFANEHGFFLTQAHPFRGKCTPTPHAVHAMEAYNSTPSYFVETDEARVSELNRAYHLPLTGGSDCHRLEDACRTGIITKRIVWCLYDF